MAVNPFSYVPTQPIIQTYVPLPFQELAYLGKQQQVNQEDLLKDVSQIDILGKSIKYAPWREQEAKDLQKGINDTIQDLANNTYKGNSQEAKQDVNAYKRKMSEEFQFGKPAQLEKEYNAYITREKDLKEALQRGQEQKPGGLSPEEYNALRSEDMQSVQNGTYSPQQFTTDPGMFEDAQKLGKEMESWSTEQYDAWAQSIPQATEKLQRYKTGVIGKDYNTIRAAVSTALQSNPKYQPYLNQVARLGVNEFERSGQLAASIRPGLDPYTAQQEAQGQKEAYANHIIGDRINKAASSSAGLNQYQKRTVDSQLTSSLAIEEELKNNNTKKLQDKLIIFNEGAAVNLTPDEFKSSKERLDNLVNDYKQTEKDLAGIKGQYGDNSRQYITKKKELEGKGIELNNTKSTIDAIDNQIQKSTHKVDYDTIYKDYLSTFTGVGGELSPLNKQGDSSKPLTKEEFIDYTKHFDTYKKSFEEEAKSGKPDRIYNDHNYSLLERANKEKDVKEKKYLEENKIAYTAQPIFGQPGSTVDNMNNLLTTSFRNSITNYTTINGLSVQDMLVKKYADRDPKLDELVITHKTIGGNPVQYLSIKDKNGTVIGNEYITPSVGGLAEMKSAAISILKSQPVNSEEWNKGKDMLINSEYLPQIQKVNLDDGGVKTVNFGNGNTVNIKKIDDTKNHIVYYELLDPHGNKPLYESDGTTPLHAGSEEEIAEMIFNIKNK